MLSSYVSSASQKLLAVVGAALFASALLLAAPAPASAQVCASSSDTQATCACPKSGNGVTCYGANEIYVPAGVGGNVCPNDPRPCAAGFFFNCGTGTCQCPSGQTNCGGTCVSNVCPSGTAFACVGTTGSCSTPYVLLAPGGAQSGNPNIAGGITATGNGSFGGTLTSTGNISTSGDVNLGGDTYFANGRALRIDGSGLTTLTVGNWGTGAAGSALQVRGPIRGQFGMGSGEVLRVGDDAAIYDVNWGNGFRVQGLYDPTVAGIGLGSSAFIWGANGNIGINDSAPLARLDLANNVGTGFIDTFSEYQIMLWNDAAATSSYGLGIMPNTMVFNSGGGNYRFDRGGVATTMTLASNGNVGIGTTASPARPLEVSTTGIWPARFTSSNAGGTAIEISNTTSRIWENAVGGSGSVVGNGSYYIWDQTAGSARFVITPLGYVGLGARANQASVALDVSATANNATARLADDSAGGTLRTGLRLDRPLNTERWFFGMNPSNNDITLVRNGDTANPVILIDDSTGDITFNDGFTVTADGDPEFPAGGLFCAQPEYVGLTGTAVDGNGLANYAGVNTACNAAFAGSHACTPDEILRTVSCTPGSLPASPTFAWVSNGPPGFTYPASDDCYGWTSDAASSYGAIWLFNGATGGSGGVTACNQTARVACCR